MGSGIKTEPCYSLETLILKSHSIQSRSHPWIRINVGSQVLDPYDGQYIHLDHRIQLDYMLITN